MNLAFSTRGWRDNDWMKQVEDACDMQFRGIEVYNLHKISSLTDRGGAFHKYNRNETDRLLQDRLDRIEKTDPDTCTDYGK